VRPSNQRVLGLLCLVCVATAALSLAGGAPAARAQELDGFSPAPGKGDVALSISFDSYDEFWVGTEKVSVPDLGTIDTNSLSIWWRHGLTERLALVATLPYVDVEGDGLANLSDSGIQDATVLAQYRLWTRESGARHSFVVAGGIKTPVGDYEGDAPVSLGDDTTDVLLRAVYLLQSGSFYLSTQVGYDLRGDDAPDGLPLAVTGGWSFGRATVSATYARYFADGGTDIGDPGFTFPSNKDEYERIGAKLFSRFNDSFGWSIAAFTTLDGRNSGDTTGYSAGLVFSY
jgi:hypothetical protein